MNEMLYDAIGDVREDWILDAEQAMGKKSQRLWIRLLAASLALALLALPVHAEYDNGYVSNLLAPLFGYAQTELVDSIGVPINASVEVGEYLLTAEAVIGDRYNVAIVYALTRQDGGILPDVFVPIDTTRAEVVRRAYSLAGDFIVNDISAGEDDPQMLPLVGSLGLEYVAMHKRGNPRSMDALCDYPEGVVAAVQDYFAAFAARAERCGVRRWILDPGLGFAKTAAQNWELLSHLGEFGRFGRPILIGAADKRFTAGDTEKAHRLALANGAGILRVHDVPAAAALRGA